MSGSNIERIESKIDKTIAGATPIEMSLGGIQFQTMMELMEFAKMMAVSDLAVPSHLRGNPGACLAVCTRALRFGFDPFSLAEHSYAMEKNSKNEAGQWEKVSTIAYDSFVIHAIIEAHAQLVGRLRMTFQGEGDERTCTVAGTPRGEKEPLVHTSPKIGDLKKARGRNDKGQIKGSQLWDGPKADQQLAYDTRRDFCRRYFPEILLGWYDKAELEDYNARAAVDVTPKPDVAERLGKRKGRGFHASNVEALPPPSETPLPTALWDKAAGEPVVIDGSDIKAAGVPFSRHPPQEPEPPAPDEARDEIAKKIAAIQGADTKADLNAMLDSAKEYLKEVGRADLLNELLSAANARSKKLKV